MTPANAAEGSRNPSKGPLSALFLTIFIDLVGFSIIFPLFPAILSHYLALEGPDSAVGRLQSYLAGLTVAGVDPALQVNVLFGGVLGSLYSFLQFVSSPALGRLSDRWGRRRVLRLTVAGNALGYLLWVFAGSFWLLVASRLVTGLMAGNIAVASAAIADATPPDKRTRGMALVGLAFGIGFIIGPAIGSLAVHYNPLDHAPGLAACGVNPFSAAAGLALVLSLLNLALIQRRLPETLNTVSSASERPRLSFGRGPLLLAAWTNFLFLFGFASMEFMLTFLAVERLAYAPTDMWRLFVFIGVILTITQGFVVRRYARVIGERRLLWFGLTNVAAGLFILGGAQQEPVFFLGLSLNALGMACSMPSLSSLASLYAPPHLQGRIMGSFRSLGALARALGPLLGSALYWRHGSHFAYAVGAVVLLAALALALKLPKPNPAHS